MLLMPIWLVQILEIILSVTILTLNIVVILRAITRPNRSPASRVAWVAVILLVPLFGVIAYFFLGETSIGKARVIKLRRARKKLAAPKDEYFKPEHLPPRANLLFDLAYSINHFRPVLGNRIELMDDSNASINSLIKDIDQAQVHVHISFYIWLDDHSGAKVVEALCDAARRGVQCRIMIDALGSGSFIKSKQYLRLKDSGIQLVIALDDIKRIGKLAVGRMDIRNHRKIVVIDNKIAYCGSQNCADAQFKVKPKFAPWVDIFFRCQGQIVRQQQHLFLTHWIAATQDFQLKDLPAADPAPVHFENGAVAQMFGTGPTNRAHAMSDMFTACMYDACQEILITTPYFVPDDAVLRALCAAPRRGIKTTIIFPKYNDSWLAGNACRSTYKELLESGVEVYEYPLGLLHSKSLVVDDDLALVGSANMDRRSLELNFENNLLIYDKAVAATIKKRQLSYLEASTAVGLGAVRQWPFRKRLVQNSVGMMAPLL